MVDDWRVAAWHPAEGYDIGTLKYASSFEVSYRAEEVCKDSCKVSVEADADRCPEKLVCKQGYLKCQRDRYCLSDKRILPSQYLHRPGDSCHQICSHRCIYHR